MNTFPEEPNNFNVLQKERSYIFSEAENDEESKQAEDDEFAEPQLYNEDNDQNSMFDREIDEEGEGCQEGEYYNIQDENIDVEDIEDDIDDNIEENEDEIKNQYYGQLDTEMPTSPKSQT